MSLPSPRGRDDPPEAHRRPRGARTYVVGSRQDRPNLPDAAARSAREGSRRPRTTTSAGSANRWPAMPDDRCEVVLYTPSTTRRSGRSGSTAREGGRSLGGAHAPRSGRGPTSTTCSSSRTAAPTVGATIAHPHGQIYAFEFVPELPLRELERGTRLDEPGDRLVAEAPGWCAWVPEAPIFPYAVRLAPDAPVPDLPSLDGAGRNGARGAARRRPGALRPAVRRPDAVHALDPPAPVRRPRLAGGPAARRDRDAVARARRAALRRRRRAGLRRLLQPGRARGRCAVAPRSRERARRHSSRCSSSAAGGVGDCPSCEPQPAAAAGDARRAAPRASAAPRRPWEFRLARAARGGRRARSPGARLGHGRGAGPLDDAGLRQAALHERRHAVRRSTAARSRAEPDRHLPAHVLGPARVEARRVVLGFGGAEGALYVLVNGKPVGIAKDARTPAEFDITRGRPPRRAERARRRRRPLVRRELRRGPGPVVARRAARARSASCRRPCATSSARAGPTGGLTVLADGEGDARLLDARGRDSREGRRGRRSRRRCARPRLWSAEDPALYTLELDARTARRSRLSVGFRTVEIRDRPAARQRRGRC